MVDDSINIDSNTDGVTSVQHVNELLLIATTAVELIADWLVSLIPRSVWIVNVGVLVWWRNLNGSVAFWSQESLALSGYTILNVTI